MEQRRFPIFAERFAELRGGKTQGEFADFLGISRPTVGFYENGTRIPDALVLREVANRCNVSADWLLGLSDVQSSSIDLKGVCEYTGLSESSAEWLHDFGLEPEFHKDCMMVLNRFMGTVEFENLLSYINYAGNVIRESDENRDNRPFLQMEELAPAIDEVQEAMSDAGLVGYKIVDADKFADYTKGELQGMFMYVFNQLFIKNWSE